MTNYLESKRNFFHDFSSLSFAVTHSSLFIFIEKDKKKESIQKYLKRKNSINIVSFVDIRHNHNETDDLDKQLDWFDIQHKYTSLDNLVQLKLDIQDNRHRSLVIVVDVCVDDDVYWRKKKFNEE